MHIVPVPVIHLACKTIAHIDAASALALRANEFVVSNTIDVVPQISYASILLIQQFDHLGSALIALVAWMIQNAI